MIIIRIYIRWLLMLREMEEHTLAKILSEQLGYEKLVLCNCLAL